MLLEHREKSPRIHESAYIAPTATICGDVTIGEHSCVLAGAVLVAEGGPVEIGAWSIIMENVVVRGTGRHPRRLRSHVLVGPRAYLTWPQEFPNVSSTAPGASVRISNLPHRYMCGPRRSHREISPHRRARSQTALQRFSLRNVPGADFPVPERVKIPQGSRFHRRAAICGSAVYPPTISGERGACAVCSMHQPQFALRMATFQGLLSPNLRSNCGSAMYNP